MDRHLNIATFALVPTLLLHASLASAQMLDAIGSPTSANGLTAHVLARGPEAAYFNPALLPSAEPQAHTGVFVLITHGDILLNKRPAGLDVSEAVYNAQLKNQDGTTSRLVLRPLPTDAILNSRADTSEDDAVPYATLGLVKPLYKDYVVLGLYAMLPVRSFQEQNTFYSDEREQYFSNQLHFELLGDRLLLPTMTAALGSRITSWLSIGVGATLSFTAFAKVAAHLPDAGDQREVLANSDVEAESSLSPQFAIALQPMPWLRVTSTLHFSSSFDGEGVSRVRFWNYEYPDGETAVIQKSHLVSGYNPVRGSVGVAVLGPPAARREEAAKPEGPGRAPVAAPPPAWEIGARATLTEWSKYEDRHAENPVDTWTNAIAVGLGGSVLLGDRRVAADLAYTPSPVPDQTGRTNYVDNARIGANVSFESPVSLFGTDFDLGGFLHGQFFIPRDVEKSFSAKNPTLDEFPDNAVDVLTGEPLEDAVGFQTNNPGYPGYSSEGWLLGVGLALRL